MDRDNFWATYKIFCERLTRPSQKLPCKTRLPGRLTQCKVTLQAPKEVLSAHEQRHTRGTSCYAWGPECTHLVRLIWKTMWLVKIVVKAVLLMGLVN